jgi:single stranded DNA-binding protein
LTDPPPHGAPPITVRKDEHDHHHQKGQTMSAFDINQLTMSGNLTRDPDLRALPSGQTVCNIRIAHNERRKTSTDQWTDHPQYFDVTIWSGLGEWVANNLTQGAKIVISGRLRWRQYTTTAARTAKPSTSPPTASSRRAALPPPSRPPKRSSRAATTSHSDARPAAARPNTAGRRGHPAPCPVCAQPSQAPR